MFGMRVGSNTWKWQLCTRKMCCWCTPTTIQHFNTWTKWWHRPLQVTPPSREKIGCLHRSLHPAQAVLVVGNTVGLSAEHGKLFWLTMQILWNTQTTKFCCHPFLCGAWFMSHEASVTHTKLYGTCKQRMTGVSCATALRPRIRQATATRGDSVRIHAGVAIFPTAAKQ